MVLYVLQKLDVDTVTSAQLNDPASTERASTRARPVIRARPGKSARCRITKRCASNVSTDLEVWKHSSNSNDRGYTVLKSDVHEITCFTR